MTWRIPSDIAWCRDDDSDVVTVWVVRVGTGSLHGLQSSALAVWQAADNRSTVDEVVAELSHDFAMGDADAAAEVREFIDVLMNAELLQKSGDE